MRRLPLLAVAGAVIALLSVATLLPGALRRNAASLAASALVTGDWCDAEAQRALEENLRRADAAGQEVQADARLARLDALRGLCANPDRTQAQRASRLARAAALCAASGDWACAADNATQALALDAHRADALLTLYQAAVQAGDVEQADRAASTLARLEPQHRLAAAEQFGGWTLVGFDLDEHALEFDGRIAATLYWQAPGTEAAPQVDQGAGGALYRAGSRGIQVLSTPNLVLNGGFELTDTVGDTIVLGFPQDRYGSGMPPAGSLTAHAIRAAQRAEGATLCAELDNARLPRSGYVSDEVPAGPGDRFLMGTLVLDAGAGTRVGLLRQRPEDRLRNAYVPPLGPPESGWTRYAGVQAATEGTHAVSLQLLNQDAGHSVCFDNAFMLRLAAPVALEGNG